MKIVAKTGNEIMAEAMRQVNPDVVAAYPITPATEVVQLFASFVADGLVDTEFVPAESEHSAMSACIGAASAGGRVMTSTASQGLALMYEVLYIAAGLRLPIVLCEVNRALSSPINIHCDHSDTMGARDSGWIQLFSENSQEAYDNVIQAVKIAEHPEVLLPAMVTTDGFIISHAMERIEILDDNEVKTYLGEYKPKHTLLNIKQPITVGALDLQDYYFEHKRAEIHSMQNVSKVILNVGEEFGKKFGRKYGLFEEYKMEDAEMAIVALGSTAGTAKVACDAVREKGLKAGVFKVRIFRPFAAQEIAESLSRMKVIAVLDRSDSFSSQGGPLFTEIRSALYEAKQRPLTVNYVYGLGGRDINVEQIKEVYSDLKDTVTKNKVESLVNYLGVRE
ncbi:MAG: transketolase C-terminal domain-containing protein [Candidatus Edwardsbacteria bacterium]